MFVKYRKSSNQRLLFINEGMLIEEGKTTTAIGQKNFRKTTDKTIAFDIYIVNDSDKEMIKRFLKTALVYSDERRKVRYNFIKEDVLYPNVNIFKIPN